MPGWGKLVAGALIGVAGTVYATNEELRKKLPGVARDLPVTVRRRVESAISAGRAASLERRRQILRDLEQHGGQHPVRDVASDAGEGPVDEPVETGPEDASQSVGQSDQEKQT